MTQTDRPSGSPGPVLAALSAVIRPLARVAVGLGVTYGEVQRLVKTALVEAAVTGAETRPSQSRISLMTGLHRKDVRAILDRGLPQSEAPKASIAETVMARWLADARRGSDGRPPALPRGSATSAGGAPETFDALVASVSRDVRPRAVLDEMLRLGLVTIDDQAGDDGATHVRLTATAHVPADADRDAAGRPGAALLGLFGANLGDHAEAAAGNLLAGPQAPRRLERAVFHTHLSPDSIAALEAEARRLGTQALEALNRRALDLQRQDIAAGTATRRFRFGVYFHDAPLEPVGPTPDAAPDTEVNEEEIGRGGDR